MCCSSPAVYLVHPFIRDDDETVIAMCEIHLHVAIAKAIQLSPITNHSLASQILVSMGESVVVERDLDNTDECDFCECD